jgi:glutamate dehydrogenase (NAD(P)+)
MSVTWNDPVTGSRGYLVIDCLIDGASGGGLRMREGCTIDEVGDLARAMSLKEAVAYTPGDRYTPFGGAKGGIDCDPYGPDAFGVLTRYLEAMRPFLERHWATGEDFGLRQQTIDAAIAEAGMRSSIDAALLRLDDPDAGLERLRKGFAVDVEGILLGEVVGGYGVVQAALAALERLDLAPAATRAVVQGFGSMGGATARYLARAGVSVVGVADRHGLIANPDGLDVERLLATRDGHGGIDRAALRPEDRQLSGEDWLALDAELLVPAAMSYVIGVEDSERIRARVIAEAANVPTLPAAERALAERGVVTVPDFVANMATNAWWWWTLFGDLPPETEPSFAKIAATQRRLVNELLDRAAAQGISPRAAATSIAAENLERLGAA